MDFVKSCGCNCQNSQSCRCNRDGSNRCSNVQNTVQEELCNKFETFDQLADMPLAMAYVPWQTWRNVYDGCKGLKNGSIFEELIFPFLFANPACREGSCRVGNSGNVMRSNDNSFQPRNSFRQENPCGCGRRCDSR